MYICVHVHLQEGPPRSVGWALLRRPPQRSPSSRSTGLQSLPCRACSKPAQTFDCLGKSLVESWQNGSAGHIATLPDLPDDFQEKGYWRSRLELLGSRVNVLLLRFLDMARKSRAHREEITKCSYHYSVLAHVFLARRPSRPRPGQVLPASSGVGSLNTQSSHPTSSVNDGWQDLASTPLARWHGLSAHWLDG